MKKCEIKDGLTIEESREILLSDANTLTDFMMIDIREWMDNFGDILIKSLSTKIIK